MLLRILSLTVAAWCAIFVSAAVAAEKDQPAKPNIVYILADDLGYGDVACFNPKGKIATPNLDRLAAAGMKFTDAHSGSAVCTPTRYGLLTGRYAWRSRLKRGVQGGMSPRLIEPGRMTVASFLKGHGYHTAAIGKWHLGMTWPLKAGKPAFGDNIEAGPAGWNADFTKPITDGPLSVGFDEFFGIGGSLDMVPYVFIEDDRAVALPTVDKSFAMMVGKKPQTRNGPATEEFEAVDVLPALTRRAIGYLEARSEAARGGKPFLLYLPLAAPHTPIVPSKEWAGKSGLNPYADFVMQTDAAVGEVLAALDRLKLADNTLVIFTSDNGCSPQADFPALKAAGHNPSYVFRGTKADVFEGGHRVPFIARWPGRIKAGTSSDQTICHTDLLATCAELLGDKLPRDAGEDSVSILPALLGTAAAAAEKPLREATVHYSADGFFAIRPGPWKLALCSHSGGWSEPRPASEAAKTLPKVQLYYLANDIGEKNNLYDKHPEEVERLTALLKKYQDEGRSTPAPAITKTAAANKASSNKEKKRPNVLFLFSDDQRADTIAALGNKFIQTPNLDRLVADGTTFKNAYCMGAMQGAVCVPSRAMLLTGRTLFRIQPQLKGQETWPEMFGRAGYRTFMTGKWHNERESARRSFATGRSVFFGGMGDPYNLPVQNFSADGLTKAEPSGKHCVSRFADEAVEFIKGQTAEQPFLCYVAFNAPHDPRTAPGEFHASYNKNPAPLPRNYLPEHPFDNGNLKGRDEELLPWPRTREAVRGELADYYAAITYLDRQIGRVVDALRESGQADNTLIVFASDHGLAIGSHGLLGKQNIYDHSMHAPLIICGRGVPKGKQSETLCYLLDVFPTLGELAGVEGPKGSEGRSLANVLAGKQSQTRDVLFTAYMRVQRAVRDDRYKLLGYPAIGKTQLFDLRDDPDEINDLSADAKHAETLARLRKLLTAAQKEFADPLATAGRP